MKARDRLTPRIGDLIKGDEWNFPEELKEGTIFTDSSFPGCTFFVELPQQRVNLAINVKVTGAPRWNGIKFQSRCKIEFVGDGEPSTFAGGLLYTDRSA